MSMFQRMFGRRRSPIEGDASLTSAIEASEERPDEVNSDGFIVLDDNTSQNGSMYSSAPGYTISGANAFLPYALDPTKSIGGDTPRITTTEPQSAIDGVPFKLGSNVILENSMKNIDLSSTAEMIEKINLFNWDEYEYSFQLERSILQEFDTPGQENASE